MKLPRSARPHWHTRATMAVAAIVCVGVVGCSPPEPLVPSAGQRVRPAPPVGFAPGTPGRTSTVTIYEWVSSREWRITGKRIRFEVDHSLVAEVSRRSGPAVALNLNYNSVGVRPAGQGRRRDVVSATLKYYARGRDLTRANITLVEGSVGGVPTDDGPRHLLNEPVCGLDAYLIEPTASSGIRTYDPPDPEERTIVDRFGGSMIFGALGPDGVYDHIITCSRGFGTCGDLTSYRGWPVTITFHNSRLCDYRAIVAQAFGLLDRSFVQETPRSEGQVEARWLPHRFRSSGAEVAGP